MGRQLAVRVEKDELTFDLPDQLGTFRGKLDVNRISGHRFGPRLLRQFF